MKVRVRIIPPPFETEIEVQEGEFSGDFNQYVRDVACERFADSLSNGDFCSDTVRNFDKWDIERVE